MLNLNIILFISSTLWIRHKNRQLVKFSLNKTDLIKFG